MNEQNNDKLKTEPETKKPTVIAVAANKGGVGKTRTVLCEANCLGAAGYPTCVIDMDFNNSGTFYYLPEESRDEARKKNIADAMSREENNLSDFTIKTKHKNVDIIPSSRYLADLRSVNEKRLSRMIQTLAGKYDFVFIDCQPDYNNLTLNAINAADIIITPVLKDLDSFNAAVFLAEKIKLETDRFDAWFITINGYNRQYEDAESGKQKEYIDLYNQTFSEHITPSDTWYPWTQDMNEIKDRNRLLSRTKIEGAICNQKLFDSVMAMARNFIDEDELRVIPEVF
jgi:chromosome partitioning protein